MATNTLSFNQMADVLNAINKQATGTGTIAPTNTSEFVSVANTMLLTGYDNVINAISQVLSKTIFANRPYTRKFKGIEADSIAYGNHVRKINIIDKPFDRDDRAPLDNISELLDQQRVNKPEILQTNFYGQNVYSKQYTIFKDQLDVAFRGPDELAQFLSLVMTNTSDMIEQAHENLARATIANYIGGVIAGENEHQIVHLLTEYNTMTGLSLTAETVLQPANYAPFMKWVFARVAAISSLLTERSAYFHTNLTGKENLMRHTPEAFQRVYLYAPQKYGVESRVLADTFHDNYLKLAENETVNFWQSLDKPDSINVKPTYLDKTGDLKNSKEAISQANIFGVIFDKETLGYTTVNQWSGTSPFNQRGGYQNVWFHFTDRYWNDFTENGVVLLLD